MTALYIHGLALDKKLDAVLQRSDDQLKKLLAVHVLVNAAWAITPAQKVQHLIICEALRHMLTFRTGSPSRSVATLSYKSDMLL